ncbi:hypothetical protein NKH77_55285 [Streptomyces sp. M19]
MRELHVAGRAGVVEGEEDVTDSSVSLITHATSWPAELIAEDVALTPLSAVFMILFSPSPRPRSFDRRRKVAAFGVRSPSLSMKANGWRRYASNVSVASLLPKSIAPVTPASIIPDSFIPANETASGLFELRDRRPRRRGIVPLGDEQRHVGPPCRLARVAPRSRVGAPVVAVGVPVREANVRLDLGVREQFLVPVAVRAGYLGPTGFSVPTSFIPASAAL